MRLPIIVINSNFAVSATVFETLTLKAKMADFPHSTLVWRPRSGNPLKFLNETYHKN